MLVVVLPVADRVSRRGPSLMEPPTPDFDTLRLNGPNFLLRRKLKGMWQAYPTHQTSPSFLQLTEQLCETAEYILAGLIGPVCGDNHRSDWN